MTDWNKLKVVDLKNELKKRGLPQTGLKPALVARLTDAENEELSENGAGAVEEIAEEGANEDQSDEAEKTIQAESPPTVTDETADIEPRASGDTLPSQEHDTTPKLGGNAVPDTEVLLDERKSPQLETSEAAQPPAQTAETRHTLPSVDTQELIIDQQKRKRRSTTPPPKEDEILRKRARQEEPKDIGDGDFLAGEDGDDRDEMVIDKELDPPEEAKSHDLEQEIPIANEEARTVDEFPSRTINAQLKDALSLPKLARERIAVTEEDMDREIDENDRMVAPAIHPATSALYIRDFMRPLNPTQLKHHLATLAASPNQEPDPNVIVNFYIDPIRSHALVLFASVSAASRVRSALHARIWPDERTRKPLWVDFIPAEKVVEWIEVESSDGGGRGSSKKWEVVYDTDTDHHVTVSLQEMGASTSRGHRRSSTSTSLRPLPVLEKSIEGAPSVSRPIQSNHQSVTANLSALEQLFQRTKAKPLLYWQPVSRDLAEKRLDNLQLAKSRDPDRHEDSDINRYTFEDGDVFVDRGKEIFLGIRPPNRSARGGRPGSRGGDSYYGSGAINRSAGSYNSYRDRDRDWDRGGYRADHRGSRDSRDRRW